MNKTEGVLAWLYPTTTMTSATYVTLRETYSFELVRPCSPFSLQIQAVLTKDVDFPSPDCFTTSGIPAHAQSPPTSRRRLGFRDGRRDRIEETEKSAPLLQSGRRKRLVHRRTLHVAALFGSYGGKARERENQSLLSARINGRQ